MDQDQLNLAIRLLGAQRADRVINNGTIRAQFGDRITAALRYECEQRDREIEVFDQIIADCTEKLGGTDV